MRKIGISVFEPSADKLAIDLVTQLQQSSDTPLVFCGLGGEELQKLGKFQTLFSIQNIAFRSIIKVLFKFRLLQRTLRELDEYFSTTDLLLALDAPGFNLMLLDRLSRRSKPPIRVLVASPSIWGSRYKRIYRIKKNTDVVFCLFPFEPSYYHAVGHEAIHIGHPAAKKTPIQCEETPQEARQRLGIQSDDASHFYGILLGSRVGEVTQGVQLINALIPMILQQDPQAIFLLQVIENNDSLQEIIRKNIVAHDRIHVIPKSAKDVILASDVMLCKLGTSTLEVMLLKRPMVACGKAPWLDTLAAYCYFGGPLMKHFHAMPNIIHRLSIQKAPNLHRNPSIDSLVDEFVGWFDLMDLAKSLVDLANDPTKQKRQLQAFETMHRLMKEETQDPAQWMLSKLEERSSD